VGLGSSVGLGPSVGANVGVACEVGVRSQRPTARSHPLGWEHRWIRRGRQHDLRRRFGRHGRRRRVSYAAAVGTRPCPRPSKPTPGPHIAQKVRQVGWILIAANATSSTSAPQWPFPAHQPAGGHHSCGRCSGGDDGSGPTGDDRDRCGGLLRAASSNRCAWARIGPPLAWRLSHPANKATAAESSGPGGPLGAASSRLPRRDRSRWLGELRVTGR
jgi:hypothetical protein